MISSAVKVETKIFGDNKIIINLLREVVEGKRIQSKIEAVEQYRVFGRYS